MQREWEPQARVSLRPSLGGEGGIEPHPLAWLILKLYGAKVNGDYKRALKAAHHRIEFGCYPWSIGGDKNRSE